MLVSASTASSRGEGRDGAACMTGRTREHMPARMQDCVTVGGGTPTLVHRRIGYCGPAEGRSECALPVSGANIRVTASSRRLRDRLGGSWSGTSSAMACSRSAWIDPPSQSVKWESPLTLTKLLSSGSSGVLIFFYFDRSEFQAQTHHCPCWNAYSAWRPPRSPQAACGARP